jgi:LmbE family N-acetylglucosaminyl deacetylase
VRRVLWVFAHQDDEVAAAARMLEQRRRGDELWCVYLTDGAFGTPADIRNRESVRALASLGVAQSFFLTYGDGTLHEHAPAALAELDARFATVPFDEIGCLAWEGGHQDHDASHLVALAFALRRGLEAYEVPLYNGRGTRGALFRVMSPVGEGWERRRLRGLDALRIASMARFYPSQRRTWIGLSPGLIVRVVLLRQTFVRRAEPSRVQRRPHAGRLYYERRFGVSRDAFTRATAALVAELGRH